MVDPDFIATLSPILGEDTAAGLAAVAPGRTCLRQIKWLESSEVFSWQQKTLSEKLQRGC